MAIDQFLPWILLAVAATYAIYLRVCVVPPLRRNLESANAALARSEAGGDTPEVERLRERVQVLERIATDKHSSLEEEFDRLRSTR